MNGAAPGRETILIFCICCINCGRLYIFSRDGAGGHFKKKNPEENTNPVVFKKPLTSHSRCGCFYSQTDRRDNSMPVHSTDSPAFNLFVYFFFFFGKRKRWEVNPGAEMWNSLFSAPWQKCCIDCHSSNLSFVYCLFVVVVVRQHEIMTLAKWRGKSK